MSDDKAFLARLTLFGDTATDLGLKRALIQYSDGSFVTAIAAIVNSVLVRELPISTEQVELLRPFKSALFQVAGLKSGRGVGDQRRLLSQKRLLRAASAAVGLVLPQLSSAAEGWRTSAQSSQPLINPAQSQPVTSLTDQL